LTFSIKGKTWRSSRQVHLLCPWARHSTRCLYFWAVRQVVNKWQL